MQNVQLSDVLLFVLLCVALVQDVRLKKVNIITIISVLILSLFKIILKENPENTYWELIGGIALGMILVVTSIVLHNAFGMADSIILLAIGIAYGGFYELEILFGALVLSSGVATVLLLMKKVTKKTKMAFIPFIVVAYIAVTFQGGFI